MCYVRSLIRPLVVSAYQLIRPFPVIVLNVFVLCGKMRIVGVFNMLKCGFISKLLIGLSPWGSYVNRCNLVAL